MLTGMQGCRDSDAIARSRNDFNLFMSQLQKENPHLDQFRPGIRAPVSAPPVVPGASCSPLYFDWPVVDKAAEKAPTEAERVARDIKALDAAGTHWKKAWAERFATGPVLTDQQINFRWPEETT
ncbi:unnamed protein product, partial [Phaeothamnion confervicola]